ncbi:MAG TPA: acyltransferase [Cyclobacteriaceae bacterium]|nr:acyltransferase [Cyclobacteriaceae bacterium]
MNNPTTPYLTTLTPLRGIAALLVVVFHSNLMCAQFIPQGYTHIVDSGWLWVDFFFVLSGFIMFYVYGKNFKERVDRSGYLKYVGARFARVYPLHLFTLIVCFVTAVIIVRRADGLDDFFAEMINPGALPASLVFLQGMGVFWAAPLNTPSWSLSTEWWMYLIFPFVVPLFSKMNGGGKLFVFALLVAAYLFIMYFIGPIAMAGPFASGHPTMDIVADFGFFRCAAGFLLGMVLHEVYKTRTAYSLFRKSGMFIILFAGVLVAMHFGINDLLIIAFFPLIILAAAYNEERVKKILDTSVLQRLGDWSYSIYMVHVPIISIFWVFNVYNDPKFFSNFLELVSKPPNYGLGLVFFLVIFASTLVIAALTYRYVEVPARNYLNARFNVKKQKTVPLLQEREVPNPFPPAEKD